MAEFDDAFEKMILNEGGFKLHNVQSDRGGQTYAGIARNYHPNWPGWQYIDRNELSSDELTTLVRQFYRENFWDVIQGDRITEQAIAESVFDFAVNAGHRTAIKLVQLVVNASPDGKIGPVTLGNLNKMDAETFRMRYALAKVARYAEIVNRDSSQAKFLLGWINRTLRGIA